LPRLIGCPLKSSTATSNFRKIKKKKKFDPTNNVTTIVTCTIDMPAHQINLNPFKDQITSLFNNNISAQEIAERISSDHNIT